MTYREHVKAQNEQINCHLKMYAIQLKIEFARTSISNTDYALLCDIIDKVLKKEEVIKI